MLVCAGIRWPIVCCCNQDAHTREVWLLGNWSGIGADMTIRLIWGRPTTVVGDDSFISENETSETLLNSTYKTPKGGRAKSRLAGGSSGIC